MRRRSVLLAAALASMALPGCGSKSTRRTSTVPVAVARVETRTMPYEIEATGTVEAQQRVEVLAQVGGTIDRVSFREGENVRRGQILFQLDARPFQAALERAQAVLARDQAQAENARREAARAQALRDRGVISEGEFDQNQAQAEALAATVRADSAAVSQALLDLQYATVRAPISGRAGTQNAHVGAVVKPSDSGNPLVTINQLQPVRVRFTVPQGTLPPAVRTRHGSLRVLVSAGDERSFEREGRLVFVDNAVDPSTGTLLLKGEFANRDEHLWPGEFVRVRLVLDSQADAVVLPVAAITNGPNGPFVYVVGEDSTVSVRPVVVQRTREELAVVANGVTPGEEVVIDGQIRLGPGARVVIKPSVGSHAVEGGAAGSDRGATPAGAARGTP